MRKIKYGLLALLIITPVFFIEVNTANAELSGSLGRIWHTVVGKPPPPGEEPDPKPPGSGPTYPKCKTLQTGPAQCLLKDFNIITRATGGYNPTNQDRINLYNIIWQNAQSAQWLKQLLRTGRMTLKLGNCTSTCNNGVTGARELTIERYHSLPDAAKRYLIIHEVGHLMRYGNPNIEKRYNPSDHAGKDKGCYDSRGYMVSYYYSSPCSASGITPQSESYSEAMANYPTKNSYNRTTFRKYGGCYTSIDNYRSKCSSSYDWMKNNVYGGYEFY